MKYLKSFYKIALINELKYNVDHKLDKFIWSHGLATGFTDNNKWKKNIKNIIDNPSMEISCSKKDENIGEIGLYVKGKVLIASHKDLWSGKTENLQKRIDKKVKENIVPLTSKNINETHELDELPSVYAEIILTDISVEGIWVRDELYSSVYFKKYFNKFKDYMNHNIDKNKFNIEDILNYNSNNIDNFKTVLPLIEELNDELSHKEDIIAKRYIENLILPFYELYLHDKKNKKINFNGLINDAEKFAKEHNLKITYL